MGSFQSYQDTFLLVAGIVRLVDIVVAVALVVGWEAAALVLAQVLQRPRLHDHPFQRNGLFLWAVEDLRSLLVEDDGLAVDVAGQAAGHQEDEDDVGGHRGRVFTPGARPSVTPLPM